MFEEMSDTELLQAFTEINNAEYAFGIMPDELFEKAVLMELEFLQRALKFIDAGGLNPH